MLATAAALPNNPDGYVFEAKWDGIRALARVDGAAELFSRHANNLTLCFPEITAALSEALAGRAVILDGEIIALDRRARPSFELIQRRMRNSRPPQHLITSVPAMFFVFDLLYLDGRNVMHQPYLERRDLLDDVGLTSKPVMTSPYWTGITAEAMFDAAREMGLEGVVCKRAASVYQPGRRSQSWIKSVVRHRAPMVVGGWLPGRTGDIGSLLVGAHNQAGQLTYCGQVGFGLNTQLRHELAARFVQIRRRASPFNDLNAGEGVSWVQPRVVVNVDYREFRPTAASLTQGHSRHSRRSGRVADTSA